MLDPVPCILFWVFSLWLVEVATKSLVVLHKGIASCYKIWCRQIQCSYEKCSYFENHLISEVIIQRVRKMTCRLLLPRHTLAISLPPRIYPVPSAWVMAIMDVSEAQTQPGKSNLMEEEMRVWSCVKTEVEVRQDGKSTSCQVWAY